MRDRTIDEWKVKIFCLSWQLCAFCGRTCGQFVVIWQGQWLVARARMGRSTIFNRSHLKMFIKNRWSPVHISHGFAFKLYILHKSDNLLHQEIAYRRFDKPDSVQWKVENIMQHRLMPVQELVTRGPIELVSNMTRTIKEKFMAPCCDDFY